MSSVNSEYTFIFNVDNTCRFCLKENVKLYSLQENCLIAEFDNLKINYMFLQTFNFNIAENNHFPQHICEECLQTVTISYNFIKQVSRCNEILKYHLIDEFIFDKDKTLISVNEKPECELSTNREVPKDINTDSIIVEKIVTTENNYQTNLNLDELCKIQSKTLTAENSTRTSTTDQNLICKICGKQYNSLKYLNRHKLTHNSNHSCPVCEKKFSFYQSLKLHLKKHSRVEDKSCSQCNQSFKDDIQLQKHIKVAHTGELHKCTHCVKVFSHSSRLQKHLLSHKNKEERRLKCRFCPKRFNHFHHLRNHERIHTGSKPFLCSKCGKGFNQSHNLTVHLRQHDEVQPFPCKYCNKTFAQLQRLKRHLITHTGEKPFMCNLCGKCFCDNATLKRHLKHHDPCENEKNIRSPLKNNDTNVCQSSIEKKIISPKPSNVHHCKICNEQFEDSTALGVHMRSHTCKYVCNICNRGFSLPTTLENHLQSHNTGIRKHVCGECGLSYTRMEHLRSHVRRAHLRDKPHVCPHCSRSFCQVGELNVHLRRHTGEKPYVCSFCNKGFPASTALKIHLRTHTGEKPYKCQVCLRAFSTSSSLLGHMKTHAVDDSAAETTNAVAKNETVFTVIQETDSILNIDNMKKVIVQQIEDEHSSFMKCDSDMENMSHISGSDIYINDHNINQQNDGNKNNKTCHFSNVLDSEKPNFSERIIIIENLEKYKSDQTIVEVDSDSIRFCNEQLLDNAVNLLEVENSSNNVLSISNTDSVIS